MSVLLYRDINPAHLTTLLDKYSMVITTIPDHEDIPGSFWKESEAGLIKNTLFLRNDTPVHSALHEACHYICMDEARRQQLDTDAGGSAIEENGVCYLQIVLSRHISEMGIDRMLNDMDEWGYSFRLGSARAWYEQDAEDAFEWLLASGLITPESRPTWQVRQ